MEHKTITVSDRAAKRIAEIVATEGSGAMLRVSVEGGGCSGFSYKFDLVKAREADDLAIEKGSVTVLIDAISQTYMEGSEIAFADDLIGAAFKVKHPTATTPRACDTTFPT